MPSRRAAGMTGSISRCRENCSRPGGTCAEEWGTLQDLLPVGSEVELYPATFSGRLPPIKRQRDDPMMRANPGRRLPGLGETHDGLVRADLVRPRREGAVGVLGEGLVEPPATAGRVPVDDPRRALHEHLPQAPFELGLRRT